MKKMDHGEVQSEKSSVARALAALVAFLTPVQKDVLDLRRKRRAARARWARRSALGERLLRLRRRRQERESRARNRGVHPRSGARR